MSDRKKITNAIIVGMVIVASSMAGLLLAVYMMIEFN